jgi:hypothetical protein
MSETEREYAANYRKPPLYTRFKKGQSDNPRGRPKKNLPALLVAALNKLVFVTIGGERRKIINQARNLLDGQRALKPSCHGAEPPNPGFARVREATRA